MVVLRPLNESRILSAVTAEFRTSLFLLQSRSSTDQVVVPQSAAQLFLMLIDGKTLQNVGHEYGGKNYSTVIHRLKSTVGEYDANPVFRRKIDRIRESLQLSPERFEQHIQRWRRES